MLLDLRSRNGFAAGVHSKTEIVLQLEGDSKSMCILSTHMVTHSIEHFLKVQNVPNGPKYVQIYSGD